MKRQTPTVEEVLYSLYACWSSIVWFRELPGSSLEAKWREFREGGPRPGRLTYLCWLSRKLGIDIRDASFEEARRGLIRSWSWRAYQHRFYDESQPWPRLSAMEFYPRHPDQLVVRVKL